MKTKAFIPKDSASVLLDWHQEPPLEEEGLPPELATALAKALVEHGTVAGRWFDNGPIPADTTLHMPKSQNPVAWAFRRLRHTQPEPVITTRSLPAVCQLLDRGWGVQQQALLVLDTATQSPCDEVLRSLSRVWDWTAFTFPPPALALIAPGNDGDYILVVAATEELLTQLLDSILQTFEMSGFARQT